MEFLPAELARSQNPGDIDTWIRGFRIKVGAHPDEPLIAVSWQTDVVASPSAHLWIPHDGRSIIVDAIIDQTFSDTAATRFAGGMSTRLAVSQQRTIFNYSLALGALLQRLGYAGRASFDFILVGESPSTAKLMVVDCNARWGGSSICINVLNRLFPRSVFPNFAFGFVENPALIQADFGKLIHGLRPNLYSKGNRRGWLIVYNASQLPVGRLDVVVVGREATATRALLKERAPSVVEAQLALD
jgi:hypothetical protein